MGDAARFDPARKLLSRDAARAWRQAQSGVVVFTNGVFDLLHRGHLASLVAARAEGDHLVVGVNTDASVRRLGKGPGRPVMAAEDRAAVLAALACVDAVVLFDEDTPAALIAALEPDVLVKGADYRAEELPGADTVRARGGRVVVVPLVPGYSTTDLVRKVHGGQT